MQQPEKGHGSPGKFNMVFRALPEIVTMRASLPGHGRSHYNVSGSPCWSGELVVREADIVRSGWLPVPALYLQVRKPQAAGIADGITVFRAGDAAGYLRIFSSPVDRGIL